MVFKADFEANKCAANRLSLATLVVHYWWKEESRTRLINAWLASLSFPFLPCRLPPGPAQINTLPSLSLSFSLLLFPPSLSSSSVPPPSSPSPPNLPSISDLSCNIGSLINTRTVCLMCLVLGGFEHTNPPTSQSLPISFPWVCSIE